MGVYLSLSLIHHFSRLCREGFPFIVLEEGVGEKSMYSRESCREAFEKNVV